MNCMLAIGSPTFEAFEVERITNRTHGISGLECADKARPRWCTDMSRARHELKSEAAIFDQRFRGAKNDGW